MLFLTKSIYKYCGKFYFSLFYTLISIYLVSGNNNENINMNKSYNDESISNNNEYKNLNKNISNIAFCELNLFKITFINKNNIEENHVVYKSKIEIEANNINKWLKINWSSNPFSEHDKIPFANISNLKSIIFNNEQIDQNNNKMTIRFNFSDFVKLNIYFESQNLGDVYSIQLRYPENFNIYDNLINNENNCKINSVCTTQDPIVFKFYDLKLITSKECNKNFYYIIWKIFNNF